MIGIANYPKWFKFKIEHKGKRTPYPNIIQTSKIQIMDHRSLQPGTKVEELYKDFEYVYLKGGNFVLSTHSYGFNHRMQGDDKTMGQVLKEFLLYAQKKDNIEFVSLNKIFEGEKIWKQLY